MSKQKISTSLAPEIIIEQIRGNLQVKGWDEPEVVVEAEPSLRRLEEQDDVVRISCDGNCEVRMPSGASIQLHNGHGEARFRQLEDSLSIGAVHGSLYLRNVAETSVETVHGELLARQVAGDLKVDHVHGNVMLRDVQGGCLMARVQGNLDLRDVEGDIKVALQGNARLRLGAILGSQYEIQADGNVHCRLPEDASLQINLNSAGRAISVKLPDGAQTYRQESYAFTLGGGTAVMNISAGGTIYLSVRELDWSEDEERAAGYDEFSRLQDDFSEKIARQVESQIEAQMELMNRQINQQMANLTASIGMAGVSAEEAERIARRARESSERAATQAQEKMRRAQEKLERKLEANRRREEQRAQASEHWGFRHGRGSWQMNFPPTPPPPPKEAIMDEERLVILRMLEQKKITLEEAESLLTALEGKEA